MSCLNTDKYLFHLQNPLLLGGALAGIGSLIGGGISAISQNNTNKTNLQIARETNRANRQNQEYQNEWNLNMWNRQNEYNDPSAQRQRLEDAGLNPIFYGLDGTGNAGALQSAPFEAQNGFPMQNSGQFIGQSVANAFNAYSDAYLKKAQADNLNADTESKKAQTIGQDLDNQLKSATLGSNIQIGNLQLPVTKELLNKYKNENSVLVQQVENLKKEYDQMNNQIALAIKQYDLEKWKAEVDKTLRENEQRLTELGITTNERLRMKELALGWFEARLKGEEIDLKKYLAPAEKENIRANTGYTRALSKGQDIDNRYSPGDHKERQALWMSQTHKNQADAAFGSGTPGLCLRLGAMIGGKYGDITGWY